MSKKHSVFKELPPSTIIVRSQEEVNRTRIHNVGKPDRYKHYKTLGEIYECSHLAFFTVNLC